MSTISQHHFLLLARVHRPDILFQINNDNPEMQPLAPYIQRAYSDESGFGLMPSLFWLDAISVLARCHLCFRSNIRCPEIAPQLVHARTNRIRVYPRSFNPPHRGHLHLLNHTCTLRIMDASYLMHLIMGCESSLTYTPPQSRILRSLHYITSFTEVMVAGGSVL